MWIGYLTQVVLPIIVAVAVTLGAKPFIPEVVQRADLLLLAIVLTAGDAASLIEVRDLIRIWYLPLFAVLLGAFSLALWSRGLDGPLSPLPWAIVAVVCIAGAVFISYACKIAVYMDQYEREQASQQKPHESMRAVLNDALGSLWSSFNNAFHRP